MSHSVNNFPSLSSKEAVIQTGFMQVPSHKKNGSPFKIEARTDEQRQLIYALSRLNYLTVAVGAAGSGKTLMGVAKAMIGLELGFYKRIIITRPAVEAEEEQGFQPGGEVQKMAKYFMPIFELMIKMGSGGLISTLDDVRRDGESTIGSQILNRMEGKLIVAPLGTMRGRNFDDYSFVILDEGQNTNKNQMEMFLTRLGQNSQGYVCGDLKQVDKRFDNEDNGLRALIEMCNNSSASKPLPDNMAFMSQFLGSGHDDIPENDEIELVDFGTTQTQRGAGVERILKHF